MYARVRPRRSSTTLLRQQEPRGSSSPSRRRSPNRSTVSAKPPWRRSLDVRTRGGAQPMFSGPQLVPRRKTGWLHAPRRSSAPGRRCAALRLHEPPRGAQPRTLRGRGPPASSRRRKSRRTTTQSGRSPPPTRSPALARVPRPRPDRPLAEVAAFSRQVVPSAAQHLAEPGTAVLAPPCRVPARMWLRG